MSVKAISDYQAESMDTVDKFHGKQVVYFYWKYQLIFCAAFAFLVDPSMSFENMLKNVVLPAIAEHPEADKIDFNTAQWFLNGDVAQFSMTSNLSGNGIDHKSLITFIPDLHGIQSSSNQGIKK